MSESTRSISSNSDDETVHQSTHNTSQPLPGVTSTEPSRGRSINQRTTPSDSISNPINEESYSPNDARAMSPRRPSEETEILEEAARTAVKEQARQLQLSLLEIAESIELVKADHDKLERQNQALQDYIGGLTRSMSKGQTSKGLKTSAK